MHNSKIKRISLAVLLALMPMAANAAGLGKMTVMSGLGEPLNVHKGDAPTLHTPPYKGANILVLVGQGHSEMCAGDGGDWKGVCDYGFNAL